MIRFHASAEAELLEAQRYYAAIHVDLARSFRLEIEQALDRIVEGPDRWPRGPLRTRHYVLLRFPYSVVYVQDARGIGVAAVAHGKRKPGYWKARVKGGF